MSSRLLSARNANGFVMLPAQAEGYHCSGTTKALLIGAMVTKTPAEVQQMIGALEGAQFKPQCACCATKQTVANAPVVASTTVAQTLPSSDADFKVGLITVSDRASAGLYPTGDLSG